MTSHSEVDFEAIPDNFAAKSSMVLVSPIFKILKSVIRVWSLASFTQLALRMRVLIASHIFEEVHPPETIETTILSRCCFSSRHLVWDQSHPKHHESRVAPLCTSSKLYGSSMSNPGIGTLTTCFP